MTTSRRPPGWRRPAARVRALRAGAARLLRALPACGLVLAAPPLVAHAQTTPVRVEELRANPGAHVNEIRTVEGVVDRLVSREGSSTPAFYLEDDYGHQVLVIPFEAPPARGERVTATGVVTLDPTGDPVLTMFETGAAAGDAPVADEAPPPPAGEAAAPASGSLPRVPRIGRVALGGAALLLLVIVAAGVMRRMRLAGGPAPIVTGPVVGRRDVDFATSALWPPSDREFDGRTIRFARPDPTALLLTARLEVTSGADAGEVIRFVGAPGESVAMMFGRAPGEGPSHVQLKQKTVSRTHAVIRHRHGEWLIENLSTTNPTILNDEVLGVKERLLTDGDRIEMGEVSFRFRAS